jgi:hypothetical protein
VIYRQATEGLWDQRWSKVKALQETLPQFDWVSALQGNSALPISVCVRQASRSRLVSVCRSNRPLNPLDLLRGHCCHRVFGVPITQVFWTDLDSVFIEGDTRLEEFIDWHYDIVISEDAYMINNGMFFLKNSVFSSKFLDRWWASCVLDSHTW